MTTPDVPLRIELSFELPGTPEQVWEAIATAAGISSWFLPTDVEEHEGGAIVTHMGDTSSPGTVTGWEPHRRFAYEEPDWAGLAGHEGADVTPLATEFLVEARSGGTCVVRVVSSAFGTGAEWEREFFEDMTKGWSPFFEHLRLYLTHFPGQRATQLEISAEIAGAASDVLAAMVRSLEVDGPGEGVELHGLGAVVDRVGDIDVLMRLTDPEAGFVALHSFDTGQGAYAVVRGYYFGSDAEDLAARQRPVWQEWFDKIRAQSA